MGPFEVGFWPDVFNDEPDSGEYTHAQKYDDRQPRSHEEAAPNQRAIKKGLAIREKVSLGDER